MSPEQRVNLALELSNSVISITMDSIRDQYPHISTAKLLRLARKRLRRRNNTQKHVEDIRAILANTRVDMKRIVDQARREGTLEIFREILRPTEPRGRRTQH
jgi:hypothetical protein